jgi:nucleotide-binding universal stress UspA family protein
MALRDLMVLLDPSEQSGKRLTLAASLALRHHAYLNGVCLADAVPPLEPVFLTADAYAFGGGLTAFLDQMRAERAERIAPVEAAFRDRLARDGLSGEWALVKGNPATAGLAHARLADLIIAGQSDPEGWSDQPSANPIEEILLASGRPLMVVPRYGDFPTCGETILVGWTETREAARAVHDAMPLLAAARSVIILAVVAEHVGAEPIEVPAAAIAHHLARHGVKAVAAETVTGGIATADALLNYASDRSADLIVVGGYGHARVRELVLGGVTRSLLQHMTVPVFFSH